MSGLRTIWMGLLLSVFAASPAFSQAVSATILGTVTDVGGGVVPKAKVTLTETNTNVSTATTTNESGNFTFPNQPPGRYSVMVEQPGFKKETKAGIDVAVNSTARVDVQLTPGSVSETVEVSASAALLQTERADTTRTMEAVLMEELPLGVNRNYQTLLELVPGSTESTFEHSQFFNASSTLQNRVNGMPRQGNNYQIEGIDNNERTGLLQILSPPAESIQQVSVSTSNHDPELGRASGAVTNVILKSGTNRFHGQGYELMQNDKVDARTFFNPTVGHLVYNRFGANIGGPIKKNKLFFFADYLGTRDHEANTNQTTIPSMAYRTGDMSADLRTTSDNGKAHTPHQIYDPLTGDSTGANRTPFSGNIIPTNRLNPAALKILGFLPAPNEPFDETLLGNNYFALLPAIKVTDQVDSKIDYTLSDKDRLSGRFSFAKPRTFQAPEFGDAGGPAQGAFEGSGYQKTYSTGINYNRTLTPTLLTELRVGVAHYHNESQQSDYGKDDTTALGITGINVNKFTSGMLSISIPNFSSPLVGYSASLPWVRAEANIDVANSWTWIKKNHTMKFGGDLRRVRDDLLQDQTFGPRGVFTFGANQTWLSNPPAGTSNGLANDMASFLLGMPSSVGRDQNTYFPALRAWQVFLFAADNWQISPKFTVNLGLRWEYYPPATPAFPGGFSNYDMASDSLIIAGKGNNPMDLGMINRKKYFAPRVGLAYRLTPNTVIRSGFGMSYTPFPDNTYAYNYPVRSNNTWNTTGFSTFGPAVFPGRNGAPDIPITFGTGLPPVPDVPIPSDGIIHHPDPSVKYFVIPTDYKNPSALTWNFAVQRSLPLKLVLDVAYVGVHGVDDPSQYDLNSGFIQGAGNAGRPQFASLGKTAAVQQQFKGYSSSYHSLQVKFDRRFSGGFSMTTAFTYSKAMSFTGASEGGPYFYVNERRSYAKSDFDRTLQYVQSLVWRLPFGKNAHFANSGIGSKILGGWQTAGIITLRTGRPFTVSCGCGNLNTPNTNQTANQVKESVDVLHGINTGNLWFDTSAFATVPSIPVGTAGNVGRYSMVGPGMSWINANIARTFTVNERVKLNFRAEALNLFNHPWFSNPQGSFTNASFGFITGTNSTGTGVNGTGGGRNAQAGVRVEF